MTDYASPLLIPSLALMALRVNQAFEQHSWPCKTWSLPYLQPCLAHSSLPLDPPTGLNHTRVSELAIFSLTSRCLHAAPAPDFTQVTLVILKHQLRTCTLTSLCPLSPGWVRVLSGPLCLSPCLFIPVPPTTWLTPLHTKHFLRALATDNSCLYPQCPDHAGHTERVRKEMSDNDDSKSPKRPIFVPSFSYL